MITAIIFDCFGVLTADRWKEFTATLPPAQLERAVSLNSAYDSGHLSKQEFLRAVHELTGKQFQYVDELLDNEITKNSALLSYIAQLKAHYKIGLLSNVASSWITDKFLTHDEQKLFDAYTLSYEVGLTKPDERMYEVMAQRLQVVAGDCVFIDDVERYCTAAEDYGMNSIWYQNFDQMKAELEQLLHDPEA